MKEGVKIHKVIVSDLNNESINLMEEYIGKNLLLLIYNNQCLGCVGRAIPLAYDFDQLFSELVVIGIHTNFGTVTTTKKEIESIFTIDNLPFPIYLDENHEVFDQFESAGTPQWVIVKSNGTLNRSFFGSQEGAQNRLRYALEDLLGVSSI